MIGMAQPHIFDAQLTPEVVEVEAGDVLLLYTDGIEEGKNPGGEEFGVTRIEPVIQNECSKPPSYVLGALFYEFERFAAGVTQEDDLTALCIKFGFWRRSARCSECSIRVSIPLPRVRLDV